MTINTAKKIAMAENTDSGNNVRDYFISMEEKAIAAQQQVPQTFSQALLLAAKQAEELELQQSQINGLEQALDVSEQWISIIRASQEYNVKETFFKWRELKKYSIDNGIEIKEAPCPRFGNKKLYHVSVFPKVYPQLNSLHECDAAFK